MAAPRLAPNTRSRPSFNVIRPLDVNEEMMSTDAMDECNIHVISAVTVIARRGSSSKGFNIIGSSGESPRGAAHSFISERARRTCPNPMHALAICLSLPLC